MSRWSSRQTVDSLSTTLYRVALTISAHGAEYNNVPSIAGRIYSFFFTTERPVVEYANDPANTIPAPKRRE